MVSVNAALAMLMVMVALSHASQRTSNSAPRLADEESCSTQLSRCERGLHEIRRQKQRAMANKRKLEYQLWRLRAQKKDLDNEIVVLRHQLEHPGLPVPNVGVGGSGVGQWFEGPEGVILGGRCEVQLSLCQRNSDIQRERTQSFSSAAALLREQITNQTNENNALRTTASSLKSQLAARGVTPHPSSRHNFSGNLQSSAEYDVDSEEIERRVAASLVTPSTGSRRSH